jgi:hypothetical protein
MPFFIVTAVKTSNLTSSKTLAETAIFSQEQYDRAECDIMQIGIWAGTKCSNSSFFYP